MSCSARSSSPIPWPVPPAKEDPLRNTARYAACVVVPVVAVVGARAADATSPPAHENVQSPSVLAAARVKPFSVSGSSIIFTATEIVHSVEPTAT